MTILRTSMVIVCTAILISCNCSKDTQNASSIDQKNSTEEMMTQGYSKGTVQYSETEGDCPFTIKMDGASGTHFDPINLGEDFKNDNEKIWFKYHSLKMKNRCNKANPISLDDIKKRAE